MKVISLWFLLQQRNTNILSRQFKVNLVRCRNTEGSLDECRMLFERRFIHLFLLHTKHSSVTLNRFPRGNLKILPVNFWHPLSKLASLEVYLTDQTLPTCDFVFLAKKNIRVLWFSAELFMWHVLQTGISISEMAVKQLHLSANCKSFKRPWQAQAAIDPASLAQSRPWEAK